MLSTIQPTDKPVDTRKWIDRASIVLIFGSIGPLAFFAPKGLWIPVLLLLLFKLKTLASVAPQDYRQIFNRNALYLILPLYGALSAAWAVVPADSIVTGAKMLGYFVAAMAVAVVADRLSDVERRSVVIWFVVGLIVADLTVWLDLGTAGALSGLFKPAPFTANYYSRGAAVSACFVLPVAVGLFRLAGLKPALVFAGICVATILFLDNEASKLALILGIIVYLAVLWRRSLFWLIIIFPLAVGVISPLLFTKDLGNSLLCTLYNIKPSAAHRLVIYQFSSRKIFEKPVLGWGMDASRSIPGGSGKAEIYDCRYKGGRATRQKVIGLVPLHPHNASLQIWLDLGAVGITIFVGLLVTLLARWQRRCAFDQARPVIAGLFAVIFIIYNISFGLWQSWLIFALIMLLAIVKVLRLGGTETHSAPSG
jgi:O-antigen ligase